MNEFHSSICFTHARTHAHRSSRRRRGPFASLCTAVLFCDFPQNIISIFFLLRTMHVIKVQWISFRDEKRAKKKKKTERHAQEQNKNWRSGWDCDRKAGPKVLAQKELQVAPAVGSVGMATAYLFFFIIFLFFDIDFPSSLWGRVSFQPRSGGVPVRRFLSWDTAEKSNQDWF